MAPDVNVIEMDLPTTISSYVISNPDTTYTIILNARLSYKRRLEAYQHELDHIQNNDFQKENVQSIEFVAHDLAIPDDAKRIPANKYAEQIKAIRRRRRKIQKQLKEYERDMDILGGYNENTAFARAEQQWLFGNDL